MAPADLDRLQDEMSFADAWYARTAMELRLNETFFRKYAQPIDDWDWRQWGMKRLGSVRDCRVLDLGCGAGEEAVYLAKLGASVTAIDISSVGVGLTSRRALANGVADRVVARVMRADPTEFPDDSFDIIHGFGILHHLGLEPGLREVRRLLRPGGRGLFFEHMGNLALLEWFRARGAYTVHEHPLRWAEVAAMAPEFRKMDLGAFHLFSRLRRQLPIFGAPAVKRLDARLLATLPSLRWFASGLVIYLEE